MATNPYTSVSISGYNSSPPPDDGSQSSANQVEWQKHLDKIGDPLKTLSEGIDTNVLAAFSALIMTTDPAEETVIIAMDEFGNDQSAALANLANKAQRAVQAERAADLSAFSENAVSSASGSSI